MAELFPDDPLADDALFYRAHVLHVYAGEIPEAVEAYRTITAPGQPQGLPAALRARGPERRRFLKNLAYRYLPARALIKFCWMYLVKLGFLDGRMGFRYCLLHTFYDYQISLKLEELRDPQSPLSRKYKDISA